MSEPVQEPEQPAEEAAEPPVTDEPGPSDDEAAEGEQDEDEPAADEQGEPEPEPQHEARGVSDTEMEKRFGKAEKAAAAYARRISDIYEEDVVDLVECPLCPSIHKAFVNINDAGRVPDDVKQGVLAFLGFATEIEYKQGSRFSVCPECDGETKVKTGSKDAKYAAITCPKCKGTGFLDSGAAPSNGDGDHELVLTGPLHYEDPGEPADTDPSGEPRLLPDGRENPNFGKWPQFKIPVPPWGTTAGLTVQDAVTAGQMWSAALNYTGAASSASYSAWLSRSVYDERDELPPTLGVREPRKPVPPTLSPGVALNEPRPSEPAPGENPRVTFVVGARQSVLTVVLVIVIVLLVLAAFGLLR